MVAACSSISKINSHPRSPVSLLCAGTLQCHSPACPSVTALPVPSVSQPCLSPHCQSPPCPLSVTALGRRGTPPTWALPVPAGTEEPLKCTLNTKSDTNLVPSPMKVDKTLQGAAPGAARTRILWDFFALKLSGAERHVLHGAGTEAGLEMSLAAGSASLQCPLRAAWAQGRALSQPKSICVRLGRRLEPAWMARREWGHSPRTGQGSRQGQPAPLAHPTGSGHPSVTISSFPCAFGLAGRDTREPLPCWGSAEFQFQQLLRAGSARAVTSRDISSWNRAWLPRPACSAPI